MILFVKAYRANTPKGLPKRVLKNIHERALKYDMWPCLDCSFDRSQEWFRMSIRSKPYLVSSMVERRPYKPDM